MPIETWLIFILLVMSIATITALEIKDILSSIITVGVAGLGVSICFIVLQAPDLAIVQFLFEIFALIILIKAFIKKEYHTEEFSKVNIFLSGTTIVMLGAIFVLSISIFQKLPPFGFPIMSTGQYYLDNGARETGAANLVSAIVLDYRAYDTLGEVTVLFAAILGTLSILRIRSKQKKETGQ